MYKIGVIEDDLMMSHLIIERLNRGTKDKKAQVVKIDFEKLTLPELIDYIHEEQFDGLVIDHKLKAENPNIDYEGTDIALGIENLIYFYPVFILTSYPSDAVAERYTDVNIVYEKDRYVSDESGDFVETINNKIFTQIDHYRNRIEDAKKELNLLRNKNNKTVSEEDRIIELDHLIETSLLGRHVIPKNLKSQDKNLQELLDLAKQILKTDE